MPVRIQTLAIDAQDPAALADWWGEALGWASITEDDDGDVHLRAPEGTRDTVVSILFLKDPGPKQGKNRLHLDLEPDDHAAEVAHFESLGARRVDIGQRGDESWVVLADPEGNEFCILASAGTD